MDFGEEIIRLSYRLSDDRVGLKDDQTNEFRVITYEAALARQRSSNKEGNGIASAAGANPAASANAAGNGNANAVQIPQSFSWKVAEVLQEYMTVLY